MNRANSIHCVGHDLALFRPLKSINSVLTQQLDSSEMNQTTSQRVLIYAEERNEDEVMSALRRTCFGTISRVSTAGTFGLILQGGCVSTAGVSLNGPLTGTH